MSKQKIVIVKEDVRNHSVRHLAGYNMYYSPEPNFWVDPAGRTELHLYSYLAEKVNDSLILDIGTRFGGSAIALSSNPTNTVISYDVIPWQTHAQLRKDNILLRIGDFMLDSTVDYSKVSIIMIDVDPHDGIQEPPMLRYLEDVGWSGLLLLDDIGSEWPAIEQMWAALPYEKYDVTDIGHWSGTGLINFGDKFEIEIVG
jgi:hypothetical protein